MTNITLNTTINDSQGNSKWKGLSNASQIILSYAINRLYLSPSSSLVSLTE